MSLRVCWCPLHQAVVPEKDTAGILSNGFSIQGARPLLVDRNPELDCKWMSGKQLTSESEKTWLQVLVLLLPAAGHGKQHSAVSFLKRLNFVRLPNNT